MQPHQAYHPDVTIDMEKHHKRNNWTDSIAYWTVKSLRLPTDLFFQVRESSSSVIVKCYTYAFINFGVELIRP